MHLIIFPHLFFCLGLVSVPFVFEGEVILVCKARYGTHTCMCTCMHMGVHACRTKTNIKHFSVTFYLIFFETGPFSEPGAYLFYQAAYSAHEL